MLPNDVTATKTPVNGLTVTADQPFGFEGKVLCVHVIPSVEEMAVVKPSIWTATKIPVVRLTVTELQVLLTGKVCAVHVIPLVE